MTTINKDVQTFEQIEASITVLANAEVITNKILGELSRSVLLYMLDNNDDVRPVNRLLGTDNNGKFLLTPMNWRLACQYFYKFVPFKSNWSEAQAFIISAKGRREALVFSKKDKKVFDTKALAIYTWLDLETNDIWTFSDTVEVKAKDIDYSKRITSAVESALEKGGLSLTDVMLAMLSSDMFTADMVIDAMGDIEEIPLEDETLENIDGEPNF